MSESQQNILPDEPHITISHPNLISYLRQNFFSDNPQSNEDERHSQINDSNNDSHNEIESEEENQNYEEEEEMESDSELRIINRSFSSEEEIPSPPNEHSFDFRDYPLPIDWKSVEDYETNTYWIFDTYGYFGISLFQSMIKIKQIEFKCNDIIFSLLNYFYICKKGKKLNQLSELKEKLPKLKDIYFILYKEMLTKKEKPIIKIVLDLYKILIFDSEYNLNTNEQKEYFRTALIFYKKILSDEDISEIYDTMVDLKRSYDVLKDLNCLISVDRNEYLKELSELYKKYIGISKGLEENLFKI